MREREEKQILPRRSFFGKDLDERLHAFKELPVLFSSIEVLFSAKLSYTSITGRRRASPYSPAPLAQTPLYKYLKYRVYYATVGFDTAAAANPFRTNGCRAP